MTNLEIAFHRAYAQGARNVTEFNGLIPRTHMGFELGDVFTIPTEFQVIEEVVETVRNQFIFVETRKGDIRKLYPSQLSRRVRTYAPDGTPLGIVATNGTASKLYKIFGTVQEGMNALRGKTIRVSRVTLVPILMWENRFVNRTVYTFDLVN